MNDCLTVVLPRRRDAATTASLARSFREARAVRVDSDAGWGVERFVWRWFAPHAEPRGTVPYAAVALLGEGIDPGSGCWMRVDPVGMVADRDRVVRIPPAYLDLAAEEAAGLCARLVQQLPDLLAGLRPVHPLRWYAPVTAALAPDGIAWLPDSGTDPRAGALRTLVSECEMVFFDAPENRAREAAGRPAVNSVWCWGGGTLPAALRGSAGLVAAGDPFVRGLATLTGVPLAALPGEGPSSDEPRRALWVMQAEADADSAGPAENFERYALEPWRRRSWAHLEVLHPGPEGLMLYRFRRWSWRRMRVWARL